MFFKKIKFILILLLFYHTPLYSKSTTFDNFNSKNLSKYFSGIVASGNEDNSSALNFFNSTKILTLQHDPYLKKYVNSLVLENKIFQAINTIKQNKGKKNTDFFFKQFIKLFHINRSSSICLGIAINCFEENGNKTCIAS